MYALRDIGGWDISYADAGDAHHPHTVTLADLAGYDVIVAQRWNKHEGLEIWRRARTPYSRLVYELDDNIFDITAENWPAYNMYGNPVIRDAVTHAAEVADLVTVSTGPLAEVMREVAGHDRVVVLANRIPAWTLDLPREQRDRPRVGWGGGASHGVDIGLVASPVRRFLKRFPGWDFQVGGTDYRATIRAPEDRMFYKPWIQVNDHPREYYQGIDSDIGLAPLHPATFSNSKSGIRVIEHGARGIPCIASDCPAYSSVITHGVDGFIVKQDHEWLKYMSLLAADNNLRENMGKAARVMAGRYLIEDGWQDWARAYEGLFRPAGRLTPGREAARLAWQGQVSHPPLIRPPRMLRDHDLRAAAERHAIPEHREHRGGQDSG